MPTIVTPDGRRLRVPEGATPEQITSVLQSQGYAPTSHAGRPPAQGSAQTSDFARLITGAEKPEQIPAGKRLHELTTAQRASLTQQQRQAMLDREEANRQTALGRTGDLGAVANYFDALQQHGLNAVQGLAQLGVHGLESIGVAPRGTAAADDRAMAEREAAYQQRTAGSGSSYAGAAIGEVAPWLTGVAELRALGALPKLKPLSQATGLLEKAKGVAVRTGLLGAEGALMGAATPVTEGDDYAAAKTGQVISGTLLAPATAAGIKVGGAALRAPGKAARAARDVVQRFRAPELEAERSLAELVEPTPANIAALRNAPSYQGVPPRLAQVLSTADNPRYMQAERAMRGEPELAEPFLQQSSALQQQIGSQIKQLAGTPRREEAAKRLRRYLTNPYYESLKGVGVDPLPILKRLDTFRRSEEGSLPEVRAAADKIEARIRETIENGNVDASVLSGIQKRASRFFGSAASAEDKRALGPIRDAIIDAIEPQVPGYRANLGTYARASEPLQAMAAGRRLADPNAAAGVSFAGDQAVTAARVKALLRSDDKAKFKMPQVARAQLEGIRDALTRAEQSEAQLGPRGPQTKYDLAAAQGLLPRLIYGAGERPGALARGGGAAGAAIGSLLGPVGAAIGSQAGQSIPAAVQRANQRVGQRLAGLLANAPEAAAALEREAMRQAKRKPQRAPNGLLSEYGMPAFLLPYVEQ